MSRLKPPDTSDQTWLGAIISLGGLLFGFLGVVGLIWSNMTALLAIAAGAATALSAAFWVQIGRMTQDKRELYHRVQSLEADLVDARRQAGEWSLTANNVSGAVKSVLELVAAPPTAAPPRIPRTKEEQGEAE